jgi:hypothetical protein
MLVASILSIDFSAAVTTVIKEFIMKSKRSIPVLIVLLLFGAVGCAPQRSDFSQENITRVVYTADYPFYSSIEELAGMAGLVIKGTVESQKVVELNDVISDEYLSDDPVANPGGKDVDQSTSVYTVYTIRVIDCYKGCDDVQETVEVKEWGGDFNGVTYEFADAVRFQKNKTYIMFLAVYPDSPSMLLNPMQAAYAENGDSINPENTYKFPSRQVGKLFDQ